MSVFDGIYIDRVMPGQYGLRVDPQVGLVMPWYTHGALDEIASWNVRDKTVLEWGGGCSTFWWSRVAKRVYTIEAHQEWADWITKIATAHHFDNIDVRRRWVEPAESYLEIPAGCTPDIVCVDGSLRSECVLKSLQLPRPLVLIVDNWMQDGVYIDHQLAQLMTMFPGEFFVQADHTAHEGRPWQTAIWYLEASMPWPRYRIVYDASGVGQWEGMTR